MEMIALLLQHNHDMMQHQAEFVSEPLSVLKHNIAGVIVILAGLFFYLEQTRLKAKAWVKYGFPAMLILVGVGVIFFSRPGRIWWFDFEQLRNSSEALQHKIFGLAGVVIGLVELFQRTGRLKGRAWPHILNVIILGAGILLFLHGGTHNELIHTQHLWMAAAITSLGVVKTITDLNRERMPWMRTYVLPLIFLWLGLQLALYIEVKGQRPFQTQVAPVEKVSLLS